MSETKLHICPASDSGCICNEQVNQQYELISVLKEEILRLQHQLLESTKVRRKMEDDLTASKNTIQVLNEKVRNISENNESLMRTLQVFQREFIKRDGSNALGKLPVDRNSNGQFHLEVIRNLKSKISNTIVEPLEKQSERSPFSDYYGFFLQDESVEENAITLFNQIVAQKNPVRSSKIRSLGKKSYFHENFRHVFWFNSIQNRQRINQKLYKLLLQQLQDSLQNKPPRNSIIDLDLKRMDFKLDEDKSKRVCVQIKRLLQLFEIYRPDIKYIQGMSYLAWIFLIRMSPYQSFVCFCNLILSDPFVHSLYMFNEPKLRRIVSYFDECLADKKPKLHKHIHSSGVDSELFLIQWAYTLYSRAFSLRIVAKIWDLWFSEGYNTFYKVAMTVFELLQQEIMEIPDNDRIIDTIRSSCSKFEQAQFLRILGKQKLFEDLKLE